MARPVCAVFAVVLVIALYSCGPAQIAYLVQKPTKPHHFLSEIESGMALAELRQIMLVNNWKESKKAIYRGYTLYGYHAPTMSTIYIISDRNSEVVFFGKERIRGHSDYLQDFVDKIEFEATHKEEWRIKVDQ